MKNMILIWLCGSFLVLGMATGFVCALSPLDDSDAFADPDNDGLTNVEEFDAGTDPGNPDTDNDGLPDGWEWDYGLDPTDASDAGNDDDYSNDAIPHGHEEYAISRIVGGPHYTNWDEYYRFAGLDENGNNVYIHTNPMNDDTDGDGILDPDDPTPCGSQKVPPTPPSPDPNNPNPGPPLPDDDGDGLDNEQEMEIGTDPNNADTDGDGLNDGSEVKLGLDPNDWDTDNDKLTDGAELGLSGQSTDGHNVDSDTDGVNKGCGGCAPGPGTDGTCPIVPPPGCQ